MFARTFVALLAVSAFAASASAAAITARDPVCSCVPDINGDEGVLINEYASYQCAYPEGSCVWIISVS